MNVHFHRLGLSGLIFFLFPVLWVGSCFPDNSTGPGSGDAVATVVVSPSQATIPIDSTAAFTATVMNSAGDILNLVVAWSSSHPDIAFVDSDVGLVRGVSPGVSTISATAGGVTGTASVTVRLLPDSIPVQVNNMSDTSGPELSFITPKDGQTISGKAEIEVYSDDPSNVGYVELFVDNQSLGQDEKAPFTWSLNSNRYKQRGSVTLTATAEDSVGNGSTVSIQVRISR